ncbi:MAG: DHH family phosphoesterase [Candidatus Aenigmatarchaeota archaeon]
MEEQLENLERLILKAKRIADILKETPGRIRLVSHHDADGITAAAIMLRALQREGRDVHITMVKQLSEKLIKELAGSGEKLLMFLDLGSGQLDAIQRHMLGEGRKIIICDHHQVQGDIVSKDVMHLNPVNFSIPENVSGSGVTYLLARAMGAENKDLSELGIIGAIGDSQIGAIGQDWGLAGLNKEILKDSVKVGKIAVKKGLRIWGRYSRPIHKALEFSMEPYIPGISGSESAAVQFLQELGIKLKNEKDGWRCLADLTEKEQKKLATGIIKERIRNNQENPDWIFGDMYDLLEKPGFRDANEFATVLNATGKMKKPYLGIALCLNMPEAGEEIKAIQDAYRREIAKSIDWVRNNKNSIQKTDSAYYILAGSKISEYIISNAVSIVSRSDILSNGKRLYFGFVDTEEGDVKVSSRAPDEMVKAGANLQELMSVAASKVKGEGGGHSGAAGATIPKGTEQAFITHIEKQLSKPEKKPEEKPPEKPTETNIKQPSKETVIKPKDEHGRRERSTKKVEGKGLVRYFGA